MQVHCGSLRVEALLGRDLAKLALGPQPLAAGLQPNQRIYPDARHCHALFKQETKRNAGSTNRGWGQITITMRVLSRVPEWHRPYPILFRVAVVDQLAVSAARAIEATYRRLLGKPPPSREFEVRCHCLATCMLPKFHHTVTVQPLDDENN